MSFHAARLAGDHMFLSLSGCTDILGSPGGLDEGANVFVADVLPFDFEEMISDFPHDLSFVAIKLEPEGAFCVDDWSMGDDVVVDASVEDQIEDTYDHFEDNGQKQQEHE